MADKQEKERRKQLMNAIVGKQKIEFENNLPMERKIFLDLFDYLDQKLSENDCDDTNHMTREYLEKIGQSNKVISKKYWNGWPNMVGIAIVRYWQMLRNCLNRKIGGFSCTN